MALSGKIHNAGKIPLAKFNDLCKKDLITVKSDYLANYYLRLLTESHIIINVCTTFRNFEAFYRPSSKIVK